MCAEKGRVVVWATGGIGSIAIRAIQRRPDIELVGVWVHAQEKVGKDAGELANGVTAYTSGQPAADADGTISPRSGGGRDQTGR